jgi:hypothetical protein
MSYKKLYEYCQTLEAPIGRNEILAKVRELSSQGLTYIRAGLDKNILLGFFVSAENPEHPLVKQLGGKNIIVLARGLERPWERLVLFKELMHMFDSDLQKTNSSAEFEQLITGMCAVELIAHIVSPPLLSEWACMLMAASTFCPEKMRAELQQDRDAGRITDTEIAAKLRMPEKFVPILFDPKYKEAISVLLGQ